MNENLALRPEVPEGESGKIERSPPPESRAPNSTSVKGAARKPAVRRPRFNVDTVAGHLNMIGLGWIAPVLRLAAGENPRDQFKDLWRLLGIPLAALCLFVVLWGQLASTVTTSLGVLPGPSQVWEQVGVLWDDHRAQRARAEAFHDREDARNARRLAADPNAEIKTHAFTGAPTYIDQIVTSLKTVFLGFLLASLIALPIGVLCGLSATANAAFNPIVQILKPVSPLAWLPIVTMVVSAVYITDDPLFEKSMVNSAITVTLCSLWPTLINTALGVAAIDKELTNVARVLQLKWTTKLFKLVLPSALPLIFAGLRLSLGVGWMVLIAAEMLAQNPGLGKFVWDEFQNGSSQSLARIMMAVLTIGLVGFLLDRVMLSLQAALGARAAR